MFSIVILSIAKNLAAIRNSSFAFVQNDRTWFRFKTMGLVYMCFISIQKKVFAEYLFPLVPGAVPTNFAKLIKYGELLNIW